MNNLVIMPIIIPLLTAVILFFLRQQVQLQRWIATVSLIVTLVSSALLVHAISTDGIQTLQLGGWEAPVGISLVGDMFSALLVLTSVFVSIACLLYSFHSIKKERELHFYYPFYLFLIAGVNGSFLTGDMFNLFVFFELMLISSYVLISLGGKKLQLRESVKYVLINIISSMLFILAMAYLYSITGTLNMAHLSERIAEVGQTEILTTVSFLFLLVFSVKAGLFLYFWLPGSYGAPPSPVAAIFAALLTKVGVYAIVRMFTLIFYHEPDITHTVIMWMAALTMILGAIGAIAHWDIKKILAYNVIIAVGFMVFGLSVATAQGLSGTVFYLIHDMIVKSMIFIIGGAMIAIAKTHKLKEISGLIRHHPALGWLFFLSALALAGVPPLSGFVGKIMVLQGGFAAESYIVAGIGLITSLLVLYSVIKIFLQGFWGETILSEDEEGKAKGVILPAALLGAALVFMGLGAEWIMPYVDQAVDVLTNPELYIHAVFNP